jgi:hypothetical protein
MGDAIRKTDSPAEMLRAKLTIWSFRAPYLFVNASLIAKEPWTKPWTEGLRLDPRKEMIQGYAALRD